MGVEKQILRPGTGPKPAKGQNVTVHCTGFGKNGDLSQKFWSTKDPGQKPFTFKIGQGSVIKGWDEGVLGMQVGEIARLQIRFQVPPQVPCEHNCINPIYGTFATGGCDGFVNVWDGNNKKRLYQYPKYPTSVAALSFSRDGGLLAVASSYTYEEGDIAHEPDAIFVRKVNEMEIKPKPKAYPAPSR